MLIMLIRAEECDVALVVAARKEHMPAMRKHYDEPSLVGAIFCFSAHAEESVMSTKCWLWPGSALTHLEGLAQFGVGDLFQLQTLPTANVNKIEIVVGSSVDSNGESTKSVFKVHAGIVHLVRQRSLVNTRKTVHGSDIPDNNLPVVGVYTLIYVLELLLDHDFDALCSELSALDPIFDSMRRSLVSQMRQ